jgi:hypothetical protein
VTFASRIAAVVAVLALLAGTATGHAYLKLSDPAEDGTVAVLPQAVRLVFTEPVEVRFSVFKVYRVDADPEWDLRRINAVAGALVSRVLALRGDEADRADAGLQTGDRTTTDVTIRLRPDLQRGPYAVMWRVLSIDTHTTQGFYVFVFARRRP